MSSKSHFHHTSQRNPDLAAPTSGVWAEARRQWPAIDLPHADFAAFVTRVRARPEQVRAHAADFYLAAACACGDRTALAAFEDAYVARIPRQLARLLPRERVPEVQQALRIKMLLGPPPKIASYDGTAPLGAWLRVIAARLALDLVPARAPAPLDERLAHGLGASGHGDRALLERHLPALQHALEEALAELPPADQSLLRLHFANGLTIDALAPLFQLHRATIARRLATLRRQILARVERRLAITLPTTPSELHSLITALAPELHLTISRVLGKNMPASEPGAT